MKDTNTHNLAENMMKDSEKYTDKQYNYILELASSAYPLKNWVAENKNIVDNKHVEAVKSFRRDVKNEVLRLVKSNLEKNPTRRMASMIIKMLKDHKNGFLPEIAPENFAKIIDNNNKYGTFSEGAKKTSPWYLTGWEKHSKTYEIN